MKKINIKMLSAVELRELQLKGVEILKHVIKAIEAMGLTYYCVGGTALGAIKYRGFIPWDDDIDIAMPREDYMKFIYDGYNYLPKNLFISSCFTEKQYFGSVSKVRNIDTAYFDVNTAKFNICHGIFIDVFPIDGFKPLNMRDKLIKKINKGKITFFENQNQKLLSKIKSFLCASLCMFKSLNKCCITSEKILMKNKISVCDNVYNRIMVFDKRIFGKPIKGFFESLEVNLPENVNEYLKICYGDISKDIPPEKQYPHHYALFVSTTDTYINYKYKKGEIVKL